MLTRERIKVLVLYGDPLVASGLASTVRDQGDFELVMAGPRSCDAPVSNENRVADVVVADYERGLQFISGMRGKVATPGRPAPHVLILSWRASEWEIKHALESGARGYLTLGCGLDELAEAVRNLHLGMRHLGVVAARRMADSIASELLTSREMDVLRLVVEGLPNKLVAKQLDIAVGTVKTHVKGIFQKLGANTRTEVAAIAERRGLLTLLPDFSPEFADTSPVMTGPARATSLDLRRSVPWKTSNALSLDS